MGSEAPNRLLDFRYLSRSQSKQLPYSPSESSVFISGQTARRTCRSHDRPVGSSRKLLQRIMSVAKLSPVSFAVRIGFCFFFLVGCQLENAAGKLVNFLEIFLVFAITLKRTLDRIVKSSSTLYARLFKASRSLSAKIRLSTGWTIIRMSSSNMYLGGGR
jgi:hypothetical protein